MAKKTPSNHIETIEKAKKLLEGYTIEQAIKMLEILSDDIQKRTVIVFPKTNL